MERIRELRDEKRLSQARLAKEMGVTQQTISDYEKGRIEPSIETIKKLCKFFDVTAGYLLGIEE